MYNRYIPQSDGTFRKKSVPDPPKNSAIQPRKQVHPPLPQEKTMCNDMVRKPHLSPPMKYRCGHKNECSPKTSSDHREASACSVGSDGSIRSFLYSLLPNGITTEDILVILLLLLMCGENGAGKSNLLLTLAIYLFL